MIETSRPLAHDFVPAIRAGVAQRRIDTEAVVWSELRGQPSYLDPIATVLMDVVDGLATIDELIEDVHDALGVDRYTARRQVTRSIDLFDSAGILETSEPSGTWSWSDSQALLPEPDW